MMTMTWKRKRGISASRQNEAHSRKIIWKFCLWINKICSCLCLAVIFFGRNRGSLKALLYRLEAGKSTEPLKTLTGEGKRKTTKQSDKTCFLKFCFHANAQRVKNWELGKRRSLHEKQETTSMKYVLCRKLYTSPSPIPLAAVIKLIDFRFLLETSSISSSCPPPIPLPSTSLY